MKVSSSGSSVGTGGSSPPGTTTYIGEKTKIRSIEFYDHATIKMKGSVNLKNQDVVKKILNLTDS